MIMEEKRNIILCGFMATGKSSIGKQLASRTGYNFLDLDAAIETEEGISIPQIFAAQGESAFRELESRMVERMTDRTGLVIATGGGTIVNPQNLEKLKRCGIVVTLTADIQTILQRVGSGEDRPMLQGEDRVARIQALMDQRAHAYAQADIILDTSALNIQEAAERLMDRLKEHGFKF